MAQAQAKTDPWADDPSMKGQGSGAPSATGNNDDWKIWQQQNTPPESGMMQGVRNFAGAFGMAHPMQAAQEEQQNLKEHPIRSMVEGMPGVRLLEGAFQGAKRIGGEIEQAGESMGRGNAPEAELHGIKAIPFIGPALDQASDQAPPTTPGEGYLSQIKDAATSPAMGTVMGTAAATAPMVLGGVDAAAGGERVGMGAFPSRTRSGNTLSMIRDKAVNAPVSTVNTGPEVARYQELTQRGGATAKPVTQLIPRIRDNMVPNAGTKPLNFPEARDFYSNISAQSAEDLSRLNPTMRRQMGSIRSGMHQDLTDAAEQVEPGLGDKYSSAVREYARASALRNAGIQAAKYGIGGLGAGLAGKILYDKLPTIR
jgi:hypothetical protein